MKFPKLKWILLAPLILFAGVYIVGAVMLAFDRETVPDLTGNAAAYRNVAIFGASGTAGDGILKAAMADPTIESIQVITRRATPRMEEGVAAGKVQVTLHLDYMDYSAVREQIADSDAVFWAIGTSSFGVDEELYTQIHVDFPLRFVEQWVEASNKSDVSFHYISSSDISEDSSMMWARQKVRAENALFAFANDRPLKVIAYRPDYIGPTDEEAHLGQRLVFGFFRPVGAAVRAREIGQAMIEVSARLAEFENGDKLVTRRIMQYSDAYERRRR